MGRDLEGHCAGEQGCVPESLTSNPVTHKEADDALNKAIKSPLKYYFGRIANFFKNIYK